MKLPLLPNGSALKLAQAEGVLGGKVWPAATALCQYLASSSMVKDYQPLADCVELGSGTGAVGIYAAALGYTVTLTEHKPPLAAVIPSVAYSVDGTPEDYLEENQDQQQQTSDRLLNLLQSNVNRNQQLLDYTPSVMELDWTNYNHVLNVAGSSKTKKGFDLVLASDVTYISQLHQDLADTIAGLLLRSNSSSLMPPKCVLSHQQRMINLKGWDSQLTEFEKSLTRAGLTIVQQTSRPIEEDFKTHRVSILEIQHHSTARSEPSSELWVPE